MPTDIDITKRLVGGSFNIKEQRISRWLGRRNLAPTARNKQRARRSIRRRISQRVKELPGYDIAFAETAADWEIIYGKRKLGGVITYAASAGSSGSKTNDLLLLVITLAAHECYAVTKLYLDNEEVEFATVGNGTIDGWTTDPDFKGPAGDPKVFVQVNLGTDAQAALSQLVTDSGGEWSSNHRQRGMCHVYLKLKYAKNIFANGLPEIAFEVMGRICRRYNGDYPLQYTTNAAHVFYDYMDGNSRWDAEAHGYQFNFYYAGPSYYTQYTESLDVCDEDVPLLSGGTEKRYSTNIVLNANDPIRENTEKLLSSFAGRVVTGNWYWEGGDVFLAGQARDPLFDITVDSILSPIEITTNDPITDYVSAIEALYVDPEKNYEEVTAPPYIRENGYTAARDEIYLPGVISVTQAQRLSKIELLSRKYSLTAKFDTRMWTWYASPGEWISVTVDELNWNEKLFEIQASKPALRTDAAGKPYFVNELELKEVDPSIYDWSITEEQTPRAMPVMQNIPTPGATAASKPSGLSVTSGSGISIENSDGTVNIRAKLSWTAPTDEFVDTINVQFKQQSESDWQTATNVSSDETITYIGNLSPDTWYDFRIRGELENGDVSDWITTQHLVAGITSTPPNVQNFVGELDGGDIILSWDLLTQPTIAFYRIKESLSGASWNESTLLAEVSGRPFTTTYNVSATYKIKAVNIYGVESATETDHELASTPTSGNWMVGGITYP